jgi:hypothetical protein
MFVPLAFALALSAMRTGQSVATREIESNRLRSNLEKKDAGTYQFRRL